MDEKLVNSLLNEAKMQTVLMTDMCNLTCTLLNVTAMHLSLLNIKESPELITLTKNIQNLTLETSLKLDVLNTTRENMCDIESEYEDKLKLLQASRVDCLRKLTK